MKICYFICSNIFGGVENIAIKTLNELCKTHEVALIAPKNSDFRTRLSEQVKFYEYSSFDKRYNPFLYLEIARIARNYDIIHTHGAKATGIFRIINKFLNKKFVATKHNIRKGSAFKHVKNVISVSKQVAKTLPKESKVLYFGVKKSQVTPANLSQNFSIVSIGRLDAIKGFDLLINACSRLSFDYSLFIVGDGKERKNLEQLARDLNLCERVKFLGFQDNVREILSGANLQVIASHSEGMPNTLLEGIFYSNALISTPVGGIPELLDERFLTDHANLSQKIEQIYQNYQDFQTDFKAHCETLQTQLSLQNHIASLNAYYKEIT